MNKGSDSDEHQLRLKHEIDEEVSKLSDTDILLNFNKAIKAIYPSLIAIQSYCYDPWDNIVEFLFRHMVYETFEWKYGINISPNEAMIYNFYTFNKHYIQCIPKTYPLRVTKGHAYNNAGHDWHTLSKDELEGKNIIFIEFGDGSHCLTGSFKTEEAYTVTFDLAEIQIEDKQRIIIPNKNKLDANDFESAIEKRYFAHIEDLEFKFV